MSEEYKFWLVAESGAQASSKRFSTKEAALDQASKQAVNKNATVFVLEAVEAIRPKPVEVEKVRTVKAPEQKEDK